jgi:hypothetical protein
VGDPHGRTLTISCGAALYYVRLAARHFGHEAVVERLPAPAQPDLLARLRLEHGALPSRSDERLFEAIPDRHTNRRGFHPGFIPPYLLQQLAESASEEGAWLVTESSEAGKNHLAELVAEGDRIQLADADLRNERADWMRRASGPTHDGLPAAAFGVPPSLDFATGLVAAAMRLDGAAQAQAYRDAELSTGPGVLVILGTDGDTPAEWLRAGEALAHVLLRATAAGLDASFLNAAIEVPALRDRVACAAGRTGFPQPMLRLGYGPPAAQTPRRGVDEVVG